MNTRFSALLIASLAGLMLSGQAVAGPRYMDKGFQHFSVSEDRAERDYGKREDREMHRPSRSQDKKSEHKADRSERERGYGYGYERRYLKPQHDERGRR